MKQARELLKAADIAAMSAIRSVHTLNPNAIRHKKPVGDLTGLTQLGALVITLMPGTNRRNITGTTTRKSVSTFSPARAKRTSTKRLMP